MSRPDELRKAHTQAVERISKIGRLQHHLKSAGRLHAVTVKTEVCHQENPSDTNYWSDEKFDAALALVIQRQFSSLAEAALLLMKMQADKALLGEKAELLARLEQIAAIETGSVV